MTNLAKHLSKNHIYNEEGGHFLQGANFRKLANAISLALEFVKIGNRQFELLGNLQKLGIVNYQQESLQQNL
jgi:hypothetical protein